MNPARRIAIVLATVLSLCGRAGAEETAEPLTGETRVYYIGADEVDWNYAPAGNVLLELQCCGDDAPWLKRGPEKKPPVFKKAVFREYTDETFTTLNLGRQRGNMPASSGPFCAPRSATASRWP